MSPAGAHAQGELAGSIARRLQQAGGQAAAAAEKPAAAAEKPAVAAISAVAAEKPAAGAEKTAEVAAAVSALPAAEPTKEGETLVSVGELLCFLHSWCKEHTIQAAALTLFGATLPVEWKTLHAT